MSYYTDFSGKFTANKEFTTEIIDELLHLYNNGGEGQFENIVLFPKNRIPKDTCYNPWRAEGNTLMMHPDAWEWNHNYEYDKWLRAIIKYLLIPNGYVLNGEVKFQGEDPNDYGVLTVKNNVLRKRYLEKYDD